MGEKKNPFVCPVCGNKDLDDMELTLVSLSWDTYYPSGRKDEEGRPLFTYGKSAYSEGSEEHQPTMYCMAVNPDEDWKRCYGQWTVEFDDFDLE